MVRAQRKLHEYAISAWTVGGKVGNILTPAFCDGVVDSKSMKTDHFWDIRGGNESK